MLTMFLIIFAVVCLVVVIINQVIIIFNDYKFEEEIKSEFDEKINDLNIKINMNKIDVEKYRRLTKGIEGKTNE